MGWKSLAERETLLRVCLRDWASCMRNYSNIRDYVTTYKSQRGRKLREGSSLREREERSRQKAEERKDMAVSPPGRVEETSQRRLATWADPKRQVSR